MYVYPDLLPGDRGSLMAILMRAGFCVASMFVSLVPLCSPVDQTVGASDPKQAGGLLFLQASRFH